MFFAGIDIAKRNHEASGHWDGRPVSKAESLSFANSQAGCEKLCQLFERLRIPVQDLVIGMEATGHYWLAIHAYLTERGYSVHVINPIQSDARRMSIRQTKTDAIDALLIAQIMRFGLVFHHRTVGGKHRCPAPVVALSPRSGRYLW